MKIVTKIIDYFILFFSLFIFVLIADVISGYHIIFSKVTPSQEWILAFGSIVILVLFLIIKIFTKVSRRRTDKGLDANSKKIDIFSVLGLVILSASIHTIYFAVVSLSCAFQGGKIFCFFGFATVIVGFLFSVRSGIRMSRVFSLKGLLFYILANVITLIIILIIRPDIFT